LAFHENLKELRAQYQKKAGEASVDDLQLIELDDSQEVPEDLPF